MLKLTFRSDSAQRVTDTGRGVGLPSGIRSNTSCQFKH